MAKTMLNEEEMRRVLDVEKKWVISQSFNGWEKKDFDFNPMDVEAVVEDILIARYPEESMRPSVELYEDGKVKVVYPNTCILETE